MKHYSDRKIVASGSVIEVYHYLDTVQIYGDKRIRTAKEKKNKPAREITPEEQEQNRARSIGRSRTTLLRLVYANAWKWLKPSGQPYLPIMLTLTFTEDVKDIADANKEFNKFIKRLNYDITGTKEAFLKYVVVVEFQDKTRGGVVHYHVIFFNLQHTWKDHLAKVWGKGFVNIRKVRDPISAGRYIAKYISKKFDDPRLHGHRRYFPSDGLLRPFVIDNQPLAETVISRLPKNSLQKTYEYETFGSGRVRYSRHLLKKQQTLPLPYMAKLKYDLP